MTKFFSTEEYHKLKRKLLLSIIVFQVLFFFFIFITHPLAEEISVEPKIPAENTVQMFSANKEYESNQLIVKFKPDTAPAEKQKALNLVKGTELSALLNGEFSLISVPKGSDLKVLADNLLLYKTIESVQPNYEIESTFTPSDAGYKNQWYLKKIQMPKAWEATKGSADITVAVIDGGVQTNHPDLKGKIVSPYNAVTGGTTFPADAHGTHVAGIIAASINKIGVAGIAPNTKIMPINVFNRSGASSYDIAAAVVYAADKGANIINMSIGSYDYSYILDYATTYAKQKGVTTFAAAGNDNTSLPSYPAALSSVISVSATDSNDLITDFSNYGYTIDLAAPGEDIYSTVTGSSYKYMSGTSMASPVVAGVAATILSKNPLLTPDQVESILTKSAVDFGSKGKDVFFGYGRVDAYKALQHTAAPLSAINAAASFTATGSNKTNFNFTAQKGTTLSVFIQNSKGGTIKKIVEPKKWNGGKVSTSWNGQQDNGLIAASGSYTILAKLTNGKETVVKKSSIKLTNKTKPVIKMVASALFSPAAQNKLTIPYELNQTTAVTAKILDSRNKLVKTVMANKTVSAKSNKFEWNGTNDKGQKVKDGTYKLVVSGTGANKIKAADAAMSIQIDTVKPTAQLIILSSPYKMDGQSKPAVKIVFKEKVAASTFVVKEQGKKMKNLTGNKSYQPGSTTINWDGKTDQGTLASEGNYMYQTEVKDLAGNVLISKSEKFELQNNQKPVIGAASNFLYETKGNATFTYTLNKAASVTVDILSNGQVVDTIESGKPKTAGTHTFVWDGNDSNGTMLADGNYQYRIHAVDRIGNESSLTGVMKVSLTTIKIDFPSVVPFYGGDYGSDVYYRLSHDVTVTIEIYTSRNAKIRTIETTARKAGLNQFNWDGQTDDGIYTYPEEELYYYVIKAKNSSGKETSVKGKISNGENPDWLLSQEFFFTPSAEESWENQELTIRANVKSLIKMTLYVYEDYYSEEFFDVVDYDLKGGNNTIRYQKPIISDLYYLIEFRDVLGNTYLYEINEIDYYDFSYQQRAISPEAVTSK